LGLEPTPDLYIQHMVLIFEEVRRVLRDDGTCWLNIGDSMCTKPHGAGSTHDPKWPLARARREGLRANRTNTPGAIGLKHKDSLLIPWRLGIALQAAGWYLRQDIIWHKPNPMPESVDDRPTKSHEYLLLLSKSPQYFYDAEAIKEPVSGTAHDRGNGTNPKAEGRNSRMNKSRVPRGYDDKPNPSTWAINPKQNASFSAAVTALVTLRNKRSVWTVTSEAFKDAHFATFPKALVLPCILAGTSARGCCSLCGAPWKRVIEKPASPKHDYNGKYKGEDNRCQNLQRALIAARAAGGDHDNPFPQKKTVGWQPTCECNGKLKWESVIIPARMNKEDAGQWGADSQGEYHGASVKGHPEGIQNASEVKKRIIKNATQDRKGKAWVYHPEIPIEDHPVGPCTVLDPFLGSGTVAEVAIENARHCIGIDLSEEYEQFIEQRTSITPGLPLA
jgi:DNA modification methylase